MASDYKNSMVDAIIAHADMSGCWNVLTSDDPGFSEWNYYVPTYSSTLWTLVLIADMACSYKKDHFIKPLMIMSDYLYDEDNGIYTIKKSHFPIPCLNGNLIYLHSFFGSGDWERTDGVIDFFSKYQRFDDGDYKTPSDYPYFSNKSCYGKHSCYWGVVKLLKGLSFIPKKRRSVNAKKLIGDCIEFILMHSVCFSSHNPDQFLHAMINKLTFPNMYTADFLEALWLLKREGIRSDKMKRALDLLKDKMNNDGLWEVERPMSRMVIPLNREKGNMLVNERAKEIYSYYFQ